MKSSSIPVISKTENALFSEGTATFVLFSPCATTTGNYPVAVDWICNNGFAPVSARWIYPGASVLSELYPMQWFRGGPKREIATFYYELDVCLLVLFKDAKTTDAPARLTTLKGHFDPAQRKKDCLRSVLGADSRMLNFIHTPDDAAQFRREFTLLSAYPQHVAMDLDTALGNWNLAPVHYRQDSINFDHKIAFLEKKTRRTDLISNFVTRLRARNLSINNVYQGLKDAGLDENSLDFKWLYVVFGAGMLRD